MKHLGYRIISFSERDGYRTLYGGDPLKLEIGRVDSMSGNGIYLGSNRKFCEDYYCGLSDDQDVLLTYEYDDANILTGSPEGNGEVTVRQATLISIEHLDLEASLDEVPSATL